MDTGEVTWVNLKVLAKLEPFQKLNTRRTHFSISQTTQYIPEFIARWWVGSNRESDYNRLKELYASAKIILSDEQLKQRMTDHMKESIKGLHSLQKTYENDATMKAKIDWLLDFVNEDLE